MLFGNGLLVSIPAEALQHASLPSSVFDAEVLDKIDLEPQLASAVGLIRAHARTYAIPLKFVFRPEIFTHGKSLAWLDAQRGAITDHLAITDGSSVKLIPGIKNHLFFYCSDRARCVENFQKLLSRAPDIMGSLTLQINTALSFRYGRKTFRPEPVLIQPMNERPAASDLCVALSLREDDFGGERLTMTKLESRSLTRVNCVTMNELALEDPSFCRLVGRMILQTLIMNGGFLLLICRPPNSLDPEERGHHYTRIAANIERSSAHLPRIIYQNVMFVTDLPSAFLEKLTDAYFTFYAETHIWTFPRKFFDVFAAITSFVPHMRLHDRRCVKDLVSAATGREPELLLDLPP